MGENGAPMTIWQVWLRRLCLFVIVWAIAEVLLGAALWGAYLFARMVLDVEPSVLAEPVVGAMAMAGACLNLAIGFLGLRGARNPRKITLFFWVVTLVGSFVLALPMVYVRLSRNAVVSTIVRFYIYITRGTPLLLQLMFVYFGLPYLGIRLDRTTAAILAFLLNYTAYFTEILRGGIQSIDEGQKEAAKLLGYSNSYTFLHILLPQALRNCIPSFINESLTLLKDTCLVSILGIDELLRYAKIAAGTYATGLPFIYVGVIYLVLNMPISRGLNYLEKRLNYYK